MRRGLFALLALVGTSSFASAQGQFLPDTKVGPDDVVTRLMTFDHDNDGRVAITELSERMRPLVSRGDSNGDGALDRSEIRTLVVAPPAPASRQTVRQFGSGGYAFGDAVGLSSKAHIEGALEDLRLTADRKERALPIVTAYAETIGQTAKTDLLKQMESLLTPEQLTAFTAALNAQTTRVMMVRSNTGEVQRFTMRAGGVDLTSRVEAMQLGEVKTERARKAIEDFKARSRIGTEAERSGLMAQLTDILSDEERDNYRAALERRPVVASAPQFVFTSQIMRNQIIDVARPAVLIEKAFSGNAVGVR